MQTIKEKTRMIGLDLLKIFSMILIVIHHLSKHGQFYSHASGFNKLLMLGANAVFLPSVNIFVYASAYLIIKKSTVSIKNFFKLYGQVVFYSVLTYFIYLVIVGGQLEFVRLIKCFLPLTRPLFWFVQAYLVMYIIAPLLLKIVNNLSKKEYVITIVGMLLCLTWMGIMKNTTMIPFASGFNMLWFAAIFLMAGYQVKFGYNFKKYMWLIIYFVATVFVGITVWKKGMNVNYTTISVVMQTISAFNLLYDLKLNNKFSTKIITYISTCTFGIYLLHDGGYISQVLYKNILRTPSYYNSQYSILYFGLFVVIIVLMGIVFETIRKLILQGAIMGYKKVKARMAIQTNIAG